MTAIAVQRKSEIVELVAQGKRLSDIIDILHLGIIPQSISQALKDDPDYLAAQISYHATRLDQAEQEILDAADQTDVARARALHSAYAWRAEREQRRIWGNEPSIVINTGVGIDTALADKAQAILDKLRTVSTQSGDSQS